MLCERLKLLRKEKDLTQEEVSNDLQISRQAFANWETDRGEPNVEMLLRISNYFGVSIDFLCGNTDIRDSLYDDPELCKYLNRCLLIYDEFFKSKDQD